MATQHNKIILDDYENEILEAYEGGMLKPASSKTDFQSIAKNTMKKYASGFFKDAI